MTDSPAPKLKDQFGPGVIETIGDMIAAVWVDFDRSGFVASCRDGFEELELTPRARHIASGLAEFLPGDRKRAIRILIESLGPELNGDESGGMAGFRYLPYGMYVAEHGLEHFETSMTALYEITKRFTSESSIRPFLEHHRDPTLRRLHEWTKDPNVHVRRLVSEGTRPRLPWSYRLKQFQNDPTPVLELLEKLKDDPEEYVRRSVANNLNDIAKDHPALVIDVARNWWAEGDENRRRLVRHGLRTLIKRGDPDALALMGFSAASPATVTDVSIDPSEVTIGEKVRIEITVENPTDSEAGALVDLRVHFVKAKGRTAAKVFKGGEYQLSPHDRATVRKTISLRQQSTRTHYPGTHRVEVLLNGVPHPAGQFELRSEGRR